MSECYFVVCVCGLLNGARCQNVGMPQNPGSGFPWSRCEESEKFIREREAHSHSVRLRIKPQTLAVKCRKD